MTTAIESPTMLDLQGHISVTLGAREVTLGLHCVSAYWFNLIMACRFLLTSLKAPTASAVAPMKAMFPKMVRY